MDQRADHHRELSPPCTDRGEEGSVSTYIAAALVLPLLAMIAGAGIAMAGLASVSGSLDDARDAGVVAAEIQGGVTPSVVGTVESTLQSLGIDPAKANVSGTPGPVAWGGAIALSVTEPVRLQGFPWTLIGLSGQTVTLGGTTYATSNVAP